MSVIKFLRDITGLFNWSTDENPTSQQDYQNAVKNWVATETSIVDALLWQPETVYAVGNQVKTPSLPSESVLVCTVAGTSGANEPDYTNVSVGDTVTDGTVEWKVSAVFTSNGGTMTGGIKYSTDLDSNMIGYDYATKQGASMSLYNSTSSTDTGVFKLIATDGTIRQFLIGEPNGELQWNSLGVALYKDSGYGYLIISNSENTHGVQICWGAAQNATNAGITVTFGKAFPSGTTPRIIMSSMAGAYSCWATDITNTNFKAHSSTTGWASYIAIANY